MIMANSIIFLMFGGFVIFLISLPLWLEPIIARILQHSKDQNLLKLELAKLELEKAKLNKDKIILSKNNPGEWFSYHEYK